MSLADRVTEDMKLAMKSGEKLRLETVRALRAAILEFEKSGSGASMTFEDEVRILNTAVKKRKDAIELYTTAGRQELATKEQQELEIIMTYLPEQLSEDAVRTELEALAVSLGLSGSSGFGKLMGAATKQLKGRADGALIQRIAKELLGS
jgi:uncharacterized protein